MKKKTSYTIQVKTSYSNTRHFILQSECAEWLGIKSSSKKSIEARCRALSYEVTFDN